MAFYNFKKSRVSGDLGTGADAAAFCQSQTLPLLDPYTRRYTVQGQLISLAGGFVKTVQDITPISLRGNGSYLQGQMELQKLAELMGAK